jgi:hypothetical protein
MSISFTCTVVLLTYVPAFCMALHEGTGMPADKNNARRPSTPSGELKWGLSWRLGLKCDNCNFCGEKTKVYTESDTDTKKGQKYSTVNLGIHVGLQSSPLGVDGLRALFLSAGRPVP